MLLEYSHICVQDMFVHISSGVYLGLVLLYHGINVHIHI